MNSHSQYIQSQKKRARMDQVLQIYQRSVASVALTLVYWLLILYAPTDTLSLGVVRIGIPTMFIGSAATLNWMGIVDAALLYSRAGRKRRHPGKLRLCLRVALHICGSLALLMLSWWIFGSITDSFVSARTLLSVSRLQLVLLAPIYYYIENGKQPVRWRRNLLKECYRLPTYREEDIR